jgi:pentatricopeptide repeat protein
MWLLFTLKVLSATYLTFIILNFVFFTGYSSYGKVIEAFRMLNFMISRDILPNSFTLTALMKTCVIKGDWERARELLYIGIYLYVCIYIYIYCLSYTHVNMYIYIRLVLLRGIGRGRGSCCTWVFIYMCVYISIYNAWVIRMWICIYIYKTCVIKGDWEKARELLYIGIYLYVCIYLYICIYNAWVIRMCICIYIRLVLLRGSGRGRGI